MQGYIICWKKYAVLKGRASRMEAVGFVLGDLFVSVALGFLEGGLLGGIYGAIADGDGDITFGVLSTVYVLATLLPRLALMVRRLQDMDRSGWWLLLLAVPVIGNLFPLLLLVIPGTAGENRHGPDPRSP